MRREVSRMIEVSNSLLWPISLLRRDASIVDWWWGPGFAVFAWTALAASGARPGPHGWAALTLATGWDYFRKSLPHLKEAP